MGNRSVIACWVRACAVAEGAKKSEMGRGAGQMLKGKAPTGAQSQNSTQTRIVEFRNFVEKFNT
jgi:hypothetical protein